MASGRFPTGSGQIKLNPARKLRAQLTGAQGSIFLHPVDMSHGPHPGAFKRRLSTHGSDELSVMIATFRPRHLTPVAPALENTNHMESFLAKLASMAGK